MPKLSDKYIAGFLDADGSVGLGFYGDGKTPQLKISFSQREDRDEVLYKIHEVTGGALDKIKIGDTSYTRLNIFKKVPTQELLNRILKYLVIKRHYAGVVLEMSKQKIPDVEAAKALLKQQRRIKSLPLPNYPSRRWMAGYIDGDGCFSTTQLFKNGSVGLMFHVCASNYDTEGIELIHKAFGGNINPMGDKVTQHTLSLPPSKAIQFIGYFGKYSIVKWDQIKFILECARIGHYRNGIEIKQHLSALKAHKHRLNESGVSNSSEILETLRGMKLPVCHVDNSECKSKHRTCHVCFKTTRMQPMRQSDTDKGELLSVR